MILLLLGSAFVMALSGVLPLAFRRRNDGGEMLHAVLLLGAVGLGLAGVIAGLFGLGSDRIDSAWGIPGGLFQLRFDALSALFLLPALLVLGAGALYGRSYRPHRAYPRNGCRFRLFYGLGGCALLLLLTARASVLFLAAWEMVALSGFFLVVTDDHLPEVRRAGFLYLVATHTGTLALIGMFALLGRGELSLAMPETGSVAAGGTASVVFALGLLGFGLKAGLMPLHVWLPSAHASAPSHASALLSGVTLKIGIYGLVRLISFYAEVPAWWGWVLLGLGAVSGIAGVALALAQHDLKRLLAYHSVENIGIIVMGLGLAVLGRTAGNPALVVLGLGGALLHVVNHGLFKSLLFLAGGAVVHQVGSREIDRCGGLLRRQPWNALFFLIGAVAICGLPPLNGFVSEWLIYRAAFAAGHELGQGLPLAVLAAPALALIGGLALACFAKVFGVVFLGSPRSEAAAAARPATAAMRAAMWPLALVCVWIGLVPFSVAPLLQRAVVDWLPASPLVSATLPVIAQSLRPLTWLGLVGLALVLSTAVGVWWSNRRARHAPRDLPTWNCGYAGAVPRGQYTASSFADGLVAQFAPGRQLDRATETANFPAPARFASHMPDFVLDRFLLPVWQTVAPMFARLRMAMQNGRTAAYLFYVALTLFVLLALYGRR